MLKPYVELSSFNLNFGAFLMILVCNVNIINAREPC